MGCSAIQILALTALMTGACDARADRLDVSGSGTNIRFLLVGKEGSRSCIDRLTVAPASDQGDAAVWRIIAANPATCVVSLTYGDAGPDFGQEVKPQALRPGVTYRARASGAGFSVVRDFSVTTGDVEVR